jgi:hypothetical protein
VHAWRKATGACRREWAPERAAAPKNTQVSRFRALCLRIDYAMMGI